MPRARIVIVAVLFGSVVSSFGLRPRVARADGPAPAVNLTASSGVTHTLNGADFTRSPALNPGGINFEDCKQDVQINVPITVTNASAGPNPLTVFAGTNCDAYANRAVGTASTSCGQVYKGDVAYEPGVSVSIPLSSRQIVSQLFATTKTAYAEASDAVCYSQSTSGAASFSLYFLLTDTTRTKTLAVAISDLGADLAAAAPPPGLSLGIGDTLLLPKWTAVSDPDIAGFNVYYLPTSMVAPIKQISACGDGGGRSDGGDGGDSGSQGDAGDGGACVNETVFDSTPLDDGGSIPFDESGFACTDVFPVDPNDAVVDGGADAGSGTVSDGGVVSSTAASIAPLALQPREASGAYRFVNVAANVTTATISGLTNFKGYAVGVAAIDDYGNVGALTTTSGDALCQYPLPVTDFFSSYVSAGGSAGGGFCTISSDRSAGGSSFAVVAALASFTGLWRKRRERRTKRALS
jgi:hypothetical protein